MSAWAEILTHLEGEGPIALDDVRRWVESGDLLAWSGVYAIFEKSWSRVEPEIPAEEQVEHMCRYLLRCIDENPAPGEHLHGGYQAAWQLASSMKAWRRRGATAIQRVPAELARIYLRADPAARARVLCGVLEHAFEDPEIRPLFAGWERDPELREAYKLALEWGQAKK